MNAINPYQAQLKALEGIYVDEGFGGNHEVNVANSGDLLFESYREGIRTDQIGPDQTVYSLRPSSAMKDDYKTFAVFVMISAAWDVRVQKALFRQCRYQYDANGIKALDATGIPVIQRAQEKALQNRCLSKNPLERFLFGLEKMKYIDIGTLKKGPGTKKERFQHLEGPKRNCAVS